MTRRLLATRPLPEPMLTFLSNWVVKTNFGEKQKHDTIILSQANVFESIWKVAAITSICRPAIEISIEIQIWLKYICLYLLLHLSDHKETLHIPTQLCCLRMCKISSWLGQFPLNHREDKLHRISNSIDLSLVRLPYCANEMSWFWSLFRNQCAN